MTKGFNQAAWKYVCFYFLYYTGSLPDLYMFKPKIPKVVIRNAIFVGCCPKGCELESMRTVAAYNW